MTNKNDESITLNVPEELSIDLEAIFRKIDNGEGDNALNDLMSQVYATSIRLGKFPKNHIYNLIEYCKKNSTFVEYVKAAAEVGNTDLAKKMYNAGMEFLKSVDDPQAHNLTDAQIKLTDAYINTTIEYWNPE